MFLRAILLVLALLPATLLAGTRDPNTPDSQYVEFGKQFPCVKRIRAVIKYNDKDTWQYGSAVIIRSHWILTAAHVVEDAGSPEVLGDNDAKFPLSKVFLHDEYKNENVGYHDIALGYSPKDFALEFYCPLYTKDDELNKPVTIAGFGFTGTFYTGAAIGDGQRRAGHNKIEGMERAVLVCRPDKAGKFPLEFIIAPGDSGGGLFIGNELAGINSFLMAIDKKPDGTYTDEACHTRISLYADWINSTIAQYEKAADVK
jgi:Trypsin